MLLGSVFTDNQVPFSVWSTEANEEQVSVAPRQTNAIAMAKLRRLRRMQTQNFLQRAAFEVVHLFKGQSEVA
ncbi:MAG: hypothetical protein JST89_14880 [Cyanobacteria bacterium SZAS-4]|nr:hypothetical protein [Cyanobacteria bacterium SZAS-4]